jgi:hypothetical protein
VNVSFELSGGNPFEEIGGAPAQFFLIADVLRQTRASEEERAFLRKYERIDLTDRAAGLAEGDHHASGAKAVEAFVECAAADRIVDDRHAFVAP